MAAIRTTISHARNSGRPLVAGLLLVAVLALFLKAWLPVLTGERVLIGVDYLSACCVPWSSEQPRQAQNPIAADPPLQFLPNLEVTADALRHGRAPLWDPYALSGKPLLADDVPAVFSVFTLLAVPFPAAKGLSSAMLASLWVAAIGMALYLRLLGALAPATVIAGVAYATSSYLVLWLAWPQAGVAAVVPWAFAAAEWCLAGGEPRAQAALAAAVALQFLAGHAETS